MSTRSEGHQCEVCGTYGFHGVKQPDGEYLWYCAIHRPALKPPEHGKPRVPDLPLWKGLEDDASSIRQG